MSASMCVGRYRWFSPALASRLIYHFDARISCPWPDFKVKLQDEEFFRSLTVPVSVQSQPTRPLLRLCVYFEDCTALYAHLPLRCDDISSKLDILRQRMWTQVAVKQAGAGKHILLARPVWDAEMFPTVSAAAAQLSAASDPHLFGSLMTVCLKAIIMCRPGPCSVWHADAAYSNFLGNEPWRPVQQHEQHGTVSYTFFSLSRMACFF